MKLTILVGNISSGKSTWCNEQIDNGMLLSKDDARKAFAVSIGEKYIYDHVLEEFIHSITLDLLEGMCYIGTENIVLDETNMSKYTRLPFIQVAKKYGYDVEALIFPDKGEDIHVQRRLKDNHGDTSEEVWRDVYRRKQGSYEEPTKDEMIDNIIFID